MFHASRLCCSLLAFSSALLAQDTSLPAPATDPPVIAAAGVITPAAAPADDAALLPVAASLGVRYAGKPSTGAKLAPKLGPAVRRALNDWAELADTLKLSVVVPQKADVLVMGRAPQDALARAAGLAEDVAALYDKCRLPAAGAPRAAVIVVLFDDEGFASETWPGLLDALLARRMVTADCVTDMKAHPGSLMVRPSLFFTQHTWDMAGNAADGDDEYRLDNEVVHKLAQLLVEARFGRQPEVLRWGLGYVAEQRRFGNIYQFNASGMVMSADHFDWPAKTAESLKSASKLPSFGLVDTILRTSQPGTPVPGQRDAWAALDYALAREPDKLAALLAALGALHQAVDEQGTSADYRGDAGAVRAACEQSWGQWKVATLCEHLKKLK
ncbi:MAG TPA: hypothetical protein VK824_10235 [Planctomycetota bacterium]|nr:hypothetical protein [Planctomycetota bacterium]